ncbi:MAG TPA: hypothetical protein VN371_07230 [Chlorobaculum sp.]|nr:hypothetical protein [Chlorobaculum sp.]
MPTIESKALLAELFEEYTEWYFTLAEENGVLPRSISGVSEEGQQFIYLIESVDLHHMSRNKYIRFVLEEHGSVAYAYGGLALRGDSEQGEIEEVLDVVAADSTSYILGNWRVMRGEEGTIIGLQHMGTSEGTDPEKHPATWFLAGSIRFSEPERLKYGSLWEKAKPGVTFNDRNAADDEA